MPRFLVGPVPPSFARNNLASSDDIRLFGTSSDAPIVIPPDVAWDGLVAHLPGDWRPDYLVLWLGYTGIPPQLWLAPVPIIGLAPDWDLLYHRYRRVLPLCDIAFTDRPGVEVFHRAGQTHVHPANLFGLGPDFLSEKLPEAERDIDLLFVGNVHAPVKRERNRWLGRLAQLSSRWKVVIRSGVFGREYRDLLRRAKIVFNRSVRGECNQRVGEAIAMGALLFQERENTEVPLYLKPGAEYVPYDDVNLEAMVEHHLTHHDERQAIVAAAQRRTEEFSFAHLLAHAFETVERERPALELQRDRRLAEASTPDLAASLWAALSGGNAHELAEAMRLSPEHPLKMIAAGLFAKEPAEAVALFEQTLRQAPTHPLAAFHRAVALARMQRPDEAVAQAQQALDFTRTAPAEFLEASPAPPGCNLLRVEWERAAWLHPNDAVAEAQAKRELLASRLHSLLGTLTGDLLHHAEAVTARPELPSNRAALGCALARAGRYAEAIPHLRAAVDGDPFDRTAAKALFQALSDAGTPGEAAASAEARRRLSAAAPELVPPEAWFAKSSAGTMQTLNREEFGTRFGLPDTSRALGGVTPAVDTHAVLTLLAHARPRRILEIGTAAGHMTANLTEWSPDDALVFTMGNAIDPPAGRPASQADETPSRADFGRHADRFGKAHKVFFITADSLYYDFQKLAPLDFVVVNGVREPAHILNDLRKAYATLAPGGWLCWRGCNGEWDPRKVIEAIHFPEPVQRIAGTEVAFLQKTPSAARPKTEDRPLAIVWEGGVDALHSFTVVNRALCDRLDLRGHFVTLRTGSQVPGGCLPGTHPALRFAGRSLPRPAEVCVRHCWPADFSRPPEGRLVIIQPWEYGSLPRAWVTALAGGAADEVWVPSRFVRDCFVQSGVPADIVQVVPNGVDVSVFRSGREPYPLATSKKFKFLFVGGTIWRKGFDVLLGAYGKAFTKSDDVCLVVKDLGVGTFYKGMTAERAIAKFRSQPGAPAIEHLTDDLTESDMGRLYAACDCLVHPFRGEGFALPVAEAMACGLPVVVTDGGPVLDWCDSANAYLIPARRARFAEKKVGDEEMVDYPWLMEPNVEALIAILNRVVAQPAEAAAKAQAGYATVRNQLTWDHAVRIAEERLRVLTRETFKAVARLMRVDEPIPSGDRPKVSLTMIVKNEEMNLADCLGPIRHLFQDIVVVDTGSTDRTREIAASLGVRLFQIPWPDSFAVARNEAMRHARGEWIFWMDADDRIDPDNIAKLQRLIENLPTENIAFVMKCLCVARAPGETETVVDHVRLFRNDPKHSWDFRVHEQILGSVKRNGGRSQWSDVVILHTGYTDPALRQRKLERDALLLQLEDRDRPNHPYTLFNLGTVFREMGRSQDALTPLRRSLELSHEKDSIVRKLYALIAQCHRELHQTNEALEACGEGRRHYPDDAELLFLESSLLREKGDRKGARERLERLLDGHEEADHFASVDTGLRSYKARHNLAVICLDERRYDEAETHWRAVIEQEPAYFPALVGLGEALAKSKNWAKLEPHAEALYRSGPRGEEEALILLGIGRMELGENAAARARFLSAERRFPQSLRIKRLLADATLRENVDLPAAERVLRDIVALDPKDDRAQRALTDIRQRMSRPRKG